MTATVSYYSEVLNDTEHFLSQEKGPRNSVPEYIITGVATILSDEKPQARDVLVGLAITYPHAFPAILLSLDDQGPHRLNALNLWIVVSAMFDQDTTEFMKQAEELEGSGFYGTTLLDFLRSSMDEDGAIGDDSLYGLMLNAQEIAREKGLDVFPDIELP